MLFKLWDCFQTVYFGLLNWYTGCIFVLQIASKVFIKKYQSCFLWRLQDFDCLSECVTILPILESWIQSHVVQMWFMWKCQKLFIIAFYYDLLWMNPERRIRTCPHLITWHTMILIDARNQILWCLSKTSVILQNKVFLLLIIMSYLLVIDLSLENSLADNFLLSNFVIYITPRVCNGLVSRFGHELCNTWRISK